MGGITACCEHTVNAPFADGYKDPHLAMEFVPADLTPEPKESVKRRLQELATNPLKINSERHHKAQELMPMKEKDRGFVYQGQWINGKPDGYGKIYFPNGELFEGEFIDGKAAGPGRYFYQTGAYYEGNVDDNQARGQGKYHSDEISFEGTWEDSKPRVGAYQLSNGIFINVEEGNFAKIRWLDGKQYSGGIGEDLNPNGTGKMIFANKDVYEGGWRKGLMNGFGTYLWADGRRYEGEYENGVKSGLGTYFFKGEDEGRYEGQWKNGKQEGTGKLFKKENLVFEGIFVNGAPVQAPPRSSTPVVEVLPSNIQPVSSISRGPEPDKWKENPDPWSINHAAAPNPWPQSYAYDGTISAANIINPRN